MFFNKPGKPDNFKKAVYLLAAMILGVLLSLIVQTLIEITYLSSVLNQSQTVYFDGSYALSPTIQAGFFILGAVVGFFFGSFCWRKVYVERSWEKK